MSCFKITFPFFCNLNMECCRFYLTEIDCPYLNSMYFKKLLSNDDVLHNMNLKYEAEITFPNKKSLETVRIHDVLEKSSTYFPLKSHCICAYFINKYF